MHSSLRTALFLLAASAVAAGACTGSVVLDQASGAGAGAAGAGGAAPTTSTGFGPSTTTSTGFGPSTTATTSTGFGPSTTATTSTGFGPSTTATGTSATTSTTSTGTGGGGGACVDGADLVLLDNKVLYPTLVQCAQQNPGNAGGEMMCITAQTGLTPGCAWCAVGDLQCSLAHCLSECIGNPYGASCLMCRQGNCAAPFIGCSGLAEAPGSVTCSATLFAGAKGTGWQRGLPAFAFVTAVGDIAYHDLDTCACVDPLPNGCRSLCDDGLTNGPPDFCNGAVATPLCLTCLQTKCGGPFMKCNVN